MDIYAAGAFAIEHWKAIAAVVGVVGLVLFGPKWRQLTKWFQRRINGAAPRHNTCVILGQGGTGKTTLIKRVTNDDEAKPETETAAFRLHEHRIAKANVDYHITFADYRGQDLASLSQGLGKLNSSGGRRIASLIVMLDICDTVNGLPTRPGALPNYAHLGDQIAQWQGQALEAILGLLDISKVRLALILVNKIDLLTLGERQLHDDSIIRECSALQSKLKKALPQVAVEVVLGSARGASAIDIRDKLVHYAET